MPLILGTNSIKDTGFDVANSLRFNSGSSDYLTRTPGSASNQKTFTISFWIKRSASGNDMVFSAGNSSSNSDGEFHIGFTADDDLNVLSGPVNMIVTNRRFRDVSAWYHIVVAMDTTQGTASNRAKLYVNGVQETSFSTNQTIGQNDDLAVNKNVAHEIGRFQRIAARYYNGYLSEFVLIDGSALDPTSFGEVDSDSGIWKPIDVSGLTFGTNGYYLDFEDSSALGNDVSGNNNDYTANNLAATDQSTDTCTNNFATLNRLNTHSSATLSEGNLKIATTGNNWYGGSGTIGITLGQPAYFEAKAVSSARLYFGLSRLGEGVRGTTLNDSAEGSSDFDYMWRTTTANNVFYGGASQSITIGAISANDICACSVDSDGEVKFYLNDSLVVTFSQNLIADYFYFPILSVNAFGGGTESWLANFGSPPYAISSSNTDPDGYGNFEFATKGGYALNTKNLAEYG